MQVLNNQILLSPSHWNPVHPAHLKNYRFQAGSADQISVVKDEFLKGYQNMAEFSPYVQKDPHTTLRKISQKRKIKLFFSYLIIIV